MAKSQTNYATNAANNLMNQAVGMVQPYTSGFQTSLVGASGLQSNLAGRLSDTLGNQMQYGGYNPKQLANLENETQSLYDTGGYDPNEVAGLRGSYSYLGQTGGFSPQDEQRFMRQATEGTTATYGALQNQAKQATIATGGLGTAGALSQMARQGSQAQGQNTLNAQVALNQLKTQNKLAGLGGETALAGQVAQGRQQGAAQQLGLEGNVAQGALSATNIMNQMYNTTTGQVTQLGNQILQSLGLTFNTEAEAISALTNLSKNPGMFQTALSDYLAVTGGEGGSTLFSRTAA